MSDELKCQCGVRRRNGARNVARIVSTRTGGYTLNTKGGTVKIQEYLIAMVTQQTQDLEVSFYFYTSGSCFSHLSYQSYHGPLKSRERGTQARVEARPLPQHSNPLLLTPNSNRSQENTINRSHTRLADNTNVLSVTFPFAESLDLRKPSNGIEMI